MPPVSNLVVWMPPIHRIDGVEVQDLPLSRMQEAHIIAGRILICDYGSGQRQNHCGNPQHAKIMRLILPPKHHWVTSVKVEICVLVEL